MREVKYCFSKKIVGFPSLEAVKTELNKALKILL